LAAAQILTRSRKARKGFFLLAGSSAASRFHRNEGSSVRND
jgi:hypothetical protein